MRRVITLTTDFGTQDAYVGSMKGVILGVNPEAVLVDISHDVGPQNIREGAFVLSLACPYFPKGTIHVAVVDPGVGSGRWAVAVATPSAYFVAPDNGLLSYVLPPSYQAVALTQPRFWRHPVSSTFHGRDIFAPVAAYLSLDIPVGEFGEPLSSLETFPFPQPRQLGDTLVGQVLHVDRFGNLVTNLKREALPPGELSLSIKAQTIAGLSPSYVSGSELIALIGSSDYLELAAPGASAAQVLGAGPGDEVRCRVRHLR